MLFFQILIVNYLLTISLFVCGYFFTKKLKFINLINNTSISCIFGGIVISLTSLSLNFFTPINLIVGNIFYVIIAILLFKIIISEKKIITILIYLFLITLFASLIISFDNINRPDAGLYHLPYIKIIQENKIILGLTNIHFRFGTISIIQYLSAIYNNSIMPIEVVSAPVAILVSSIYMYFLSFFSNEFKDYKIKILVFFVSIFSIYSFNRFSGFGNDALAHLFFFIFIIEVFRINFKDINSYDFSFLSLLSVFTFTQKPFMVFILVIPLFIYIKYFLRKFVIFKDVKLILSISLLLLWIVKNILISGCIFYPIYSTCFEKLSYTNLSEVKEVKIASEAWSKDWPNNKEEIEDISSYNKNFNWISAWKNNHFKIITEKFSPFLIFITLSIIFCKLFFKKNYDNLEKINFSKSYTIFALSIALSAVWFLKFPLYRYGQSFVALPFIILTFIYFLKNINYKKLNKFYFSSFFVLFITIGFKNFERIYENHNIKNIWPNIYTLSDLKEKNKEIKLKPIYYNDEFIYFFSDKECLFNSAPCSNFLKTNIKKDIKLGYTIFIPEKLL